VKDFTGELAASAALKNAFAGSVVDTMSAATPTIAATENSFEKSLWWRLPERVRGREARVRGALVARGFFAEVDRMRPVRAARRVFDSGAAAASGVVAGADTAAGFTAAE